MNYNSLKQWLESLTVEQLEQDVTCYDGTTDIYFQISGVAVADDEVVENQPVLITNS